MNEQARAAFYPPDAQWVAARRKRRLAKKLRNWLPHIPDDAVVFDVGAHLGVFTELLLCARRCRKVYLFEPVAEYAQFCKRHFSLDHVVEVRHAAVGDGTDMRVLYRSPRNNEWNTLLPEMANESMKAFTEQVPVVTLDSLVRVDRLSRVDFVKVDVEGYEAHVLEGFRGTLGRLNVKPVFCIEVSWGEAHPHRKRVLDAFEWLFANGYERVDLSADKSGDYLVRPTPVNR